MSRYSGGNYNKEDIDIFIVLPLREDIRSLTDQENFYKTMDVIKKFKEYLKKKHVCSSDECDTIGRNLIVYFEKDKAEKVIKKYSSEPWYKGQRIVYYEQAMELVLEEEKLDYLIHLS